MNNDFFPQADYEIPQTSNYLKLTEGEHTFRVLSSAIVGSAYFTKDNKPVHSRKPFDETPEDIEAGGRINHFWAFVVWNYEAKRIQILEVSQKSIQTQMKALIDNTKWGNPKNYDVTITRKGSTMNDTKYTVMPNPHTPVEDEIALAFTKAKVNLEALYDGADPFSVDK